MSTRDKIVKSAVDLFIEQGVAKTTTREIAALASVAEGSIYRYFPSKDELAWQVFVDYHQQLATQLQQSVEDEKGITNKIDSLVSCFLKMADEDWLMFRYYITSQHTHMKRIGEELLTPYTVIFKIIKEAIEARELNQFDVKVMTAMVMGAVHQIATNKIYARLNGELYEHHKLIKKTVKNMLQIGEK